MEWMVWFLFIGTWWMAGHEIEKLQGRISRLEHRLTEIEIKD